MQAAAELRAIRVAGQRRLLPWLLLAPTTLFVAVLVATAMLMARMSLGTKNAELTTWTLDNYAVLGRHLYATAVVRTLGLALVATVVVVALGFPVALKLARTKSQRVRQLIVGALLLPLFVNQLLQSFGWLILLGPTGVVNKTLLWLGIVDRPLLLLYSNVAVVLAMIQNALPLAVLPIASAVRNVPTAFEEAAAVLGAGRFRALWLVLIPMSLPGIVAAVLLVFAWNAGAFVIPLLLGGGRVVTMSLLIRDQMGALLNWPLGAALAIVMIAVSLGVLGLTSLASAALSDRRPT